MTEKHTPIESNRSRRTILKALGVTTVGGLGMTGTAVANHRPLHPHPQDNVTVTCLEDGCILVEYDFRGLGNFRGTATITAEGTVEGTCTNPGQGNNQQPPGQNPQTVTATSSEPVAAQQGRVAGEDELCPDEAVGDQNPCPNENWTFTPTGPAEFDTVTVELVDQQGVVQRRETRDVDC